MAKYLCYVGVGLLLLCVVSTASAFDYGADLLEGKGDFDDPCDRLLQSEGGIWNLWAGRGTSTFSTVLPNSGTYHWAGDETDAKGDLRLLGLVDTVPNRRHVLTIMSRKYSSSGSYYQYFVNASGWKSYSTYWSYSRMSFGFTQPAGDTELNFGLRMYGDSGVGDDHYFIDDVTLTRERVAPYVVSDSTNNQLITGEVNTVTFYCSDMIDPNETFAFDPDITIASNNGTVSSVIWIGDAEVQADIEPAVDGAVSLSFRNVYSNRGRGYSMVAGTPVDCGDVGTAYLRSDIGGPAGVRDCHVNLIDFAILAEQWLKCTDITDGGCTFDW